MKLYHLKPQTLKHVEIIKVSDKSTYDTSFEMFGLEIIDFECHDDRTRWSEIISSPTSNNKHVEIIKVSDKSTYDTSFEMFGLEIIDFNFNSISKST